MKIFLNVYYYVKFFFHIVFHSFDIAKALDDSINILGQSSDPDKNKHGFLHISAKKRQEIIEKYKVLPNKKWRNYKTGKFDVRVNEPVGKVFFVWSDDVPVKKFTAYTAKDAADIYFADAANAERVYCVENIPGGKLFVFERALKSVQ
jgi:hypothetical protein